MMKKKVLGIICALAMTTVMCVPAFADTPSVYSTSDTPLPDKVIGFSYSQAAKTIDRPKNDATSNYVYNKSGFDLWVESRTPSGKNMTVNGHAIVRDGQWRVRNNVYESGYRSCLLWINTTKRETTGRLKGVWSPDCAGSYSAAN